jgi:hypothetical protein
VSSTSDSEIKNTINTNVPIIPRSGTALSGGRYETGTSPLIRSARNVTGRDGSLLRRRYTTSFRSAKAAPILLIILWLCANSATAASLPRAVIAGIINNPQGGVIISVALAAGNGAGASQILSYKFYRE